MLSALISLVGVAGLMVSGGSPLTTVDSADGSSTVFRRRTYSIDEIAVYLGISKNHAYAMAREGAFPTIRLGRRLIVPADRFDAWFAGESR
jgi:excisionase family DNA binding protein